MAGRIVDPNFLAVVQSLKPYMSDRFVQYTEAAETLIEVLESEKVKEVQEKLVNLRKDYQLDTMSAKGEDKKDKWDPYTLFLILILLLLSSGSYFHSYFPQTDLENNSG